MNIFAANITLGFTNQALAKAVFDVFFFQYSQALSDEIGARSEFHAAESANRAYEEEWRRNDGLGWCTNHPYSSSIIQYKKDQATRAEHNLKEAKALMNFVRDQFLEKFDVSNIVEDYSI